MGYIYTVEEIGANNPQPACVEDRNSSKEY
jgi:hypothetical protein